MPRQSRSVYARRRAGVLGGLAALLAAGFYLTYTLLAPLRPVEAMPIQVPLPSSQAATISFPAYGASAFGAVGYAGTLGTSGITQPLPIASITKVITAMVVLDRHPLAIGETGPPLTFDATDVQYYEDQIAVDGTREPVTAGATLSQHDVLELMLMASANNYALSLARWAFGTQEGFASAAAAWLSEHGLSATTVREPTGLDAGNTSTAADLVELGRIALAHPVISAIVATPVADVPGIGIVENRNVLLGVDGIDGIKTGTLDESGANLLFSADQTVGSETITIIGTVLGGPDQETVRAAVQAILASASAGFQVVTIVSEGSDFGEYRAAWGDHARAVAADELSAVIWGGSVIGVDVVLSPVQLADAGTDVGDLKVVVGEREYTADLELDGTIEDPGGWWRLTHPFELG